MNIPTLANKVIESNEDILHRILKESAHPTVAMPVLIKLSGLTRKEVVTALHSMIELGVAKESQEKYNSNHRYILTARVIITSSPSDQPWWKKGELKGYAEKMRAFAKACEASRN